jgi:CheY-like chemotaxis protein
MQKILLVEDNAMNRDLISRRLKRRGFEVLLAEDGAAGVEKTTAERPDLVLMDMGLPVMDGYTAARVLKDNESTRHIPIIGLSAHAMSGDAERALKAGCDDYDTKPVEWPRLLAKIQTQLERGIHTTPTAPTLGADGPTEGLPRAVRAPRVLVVDDSTLQREMLRSRLGTLRYSPEVAEDVAGAAEHFARGAFDAALVDLGLPTALDAIHQEHPELPVVLISSVDALDRAAELLGQGKARDYICPPFRTEVLKARLEACLGGGGGGPELEAERRKSAHLLSSLLPQGAVQELEQTSRVLPRRHDRVVLLDWDLADFHRRVLATGDPAPAVTQLQGLMVDFEAIAGRHGMEIVTGSGDGMLGAVGLYEPAPDAALRAARCALELLAAAKSGTAGSGNPEWLPRIGLHGGSVVAGALGQRRVRYELWGTTVQAVHWVRNHGPVGAVSASSVVWRLLEGHAQGEALPPVQGPDGNPLSLYRVDGVN